MDSESLFYLVLNRNHNTHVVTYSLSDMEVTAEGAVTSMSAAVNGGGEAERLSNSTAAAPKTTLSTGSECSYHQKFEGLISVSI